MEPDLVMVSLYRTLQCDVPLHNSTGALQCDVPLHLADSLADVGPETIECVKQFPLFNKIKHHEMFSSAIFGSTENISLIIDTSQKVNWLNFYCHLIPWRDFQKCLQALRIHN